MAQIMSKTVIQCGEVSQAALKVQNSMGGGPENPSSVVKATVYQKKGRGAGGRHKMIKIWFDGGAKKKIKKNSALLKIIST